MREYAVVKPATETITEQDTAGTLAEFTALNLITTSLRGRDASTVIRELSQALGREGHVPDTETFYQAVMSRESIVSTDVDENLAIPHARLKGLKEPSFAFGRSAEPLAWAGQTSRRVRLVFLMAVPEPDFGQYLRLVSGIAYLTKNQHIIQQLNTATNPAEIFGIFSQIKLQRMPRVTC